MLLDYKDSNDGTRIYDDNSNNDISDETDNINKKTVIMIITDKIMTLSMITMMIIIVIMIIK